METCPVCAEDLSGYDAVAANHHVNECLDSGAPPSRQVLISSGERRRVLMVEEEEELEEEESEPDSQGLLECKLCLDDVDALDMIYLNCGHRYCRACMEHYSEVEVGAVGGSQKRKTEVKCPDPACRVQIATDILEVSSRRATLQLAKNQKAHRKEMDAISGASRGFLCKKFCLSNLRNWILCGWACPQDYGLGPVCFICTAGGCFCNCFCNFFCNGFCGLCECWRNLSCCECDVCCDERPCLNFTCFGNDLEICPFCKSILQITGGCPNLTCRNCNKHFVRDGTCFIPCWRCVSGCYIPLNYNNLCGEGPCCQACCRFFCCVPL